MVRMREDPAITNRRYRHHRRDDHQFCLANGKCAVAHENAAETVQSTTPSNLREHLDDFAPAAAECRYCCLQLALARDLVDRGQGGHSEVRRLSKVIKECSATHGKVDEDDPIEKLMARVEAKERGEGPYSGSETAAEKAAAYAASLKASGIAITPATWNTTSYGPMPTTEEQP